MGEWVYRSTFYLTSALAAGEWSTLRPGRFTRRERAPGTHRIGGWVNRIASQDDVERRKFLTLPGLELQPLDRPAHSQSLYRLRYPGSRGRSSQLKTCHEYSSAAVVAQFVRGSADPSWPWPPFSGMLETPIFIKRKDSSQFAKQFKYVLIHLYQNHS
jgi:hypothetical protein